ncbi:unnamed protein product, partial [Brachionus calyciflorus]
MPETRQRNAVQNISSELVQESTNEDDETFEPNHYYLAQLQRSKSSLLIRRINRVIAN